MPIKVGSDYTKTAINLTNPMETKNLLLAWDKARNHTKACAKAMEGTKEAEALAVALKVEAEAMAKLKDAIQLAGGFQHVPDGLYALQYQRYTTAYDPLKWRTEVPKFAGIIEERVPNAAVDGLLKGKLVTENQVELARIRTPMKPTFVIDVIEEATKSE